jgi:hypothetical protein
MVDPVELAAAAPATAAAPNFAKPTPITQFEPAETRMFATLMQGAPMTTSPSGATPGAFSGFAASLTTQFGKTRTFEEIRHSMLASYDVHDPIGSMFAMTNNSIEANVLFSKLHISTSLASAATSLFGGLLKNQQ